MKFIRDLLSRKSASEQKPATLAEDLVTPRKVKAPEIEPVIEEMPAPAEEKEVTLTLVENATGTGTEMVEAEVGKAADELLSKVNAEVSNKGAQAEAVSIWDLDTDDAAAPAAEEKPTPRKRRRNQTRLLGFEDPGADVVSPFEKAEPVAPAATGAKFPVGWVLVIDGPGRGESFALEAGMSQIGRAEDQAIQLDFGDNSVSRVNHAAIVYDTETHTFILGHGGKKNIVRLNGKPVISNEDIKTGDEMKVGETTLRFVAACSPEFNWADQDDSDEESDDVAIA
ncbi:MAG: FHA domain-containing protein [Litoreibacter sp.]|nr:FHA domain-containing protein [Litoreibacter sp.]MCY4335991.1 FHA domain-containing protein [Litoreibacter sp.]